MPVIVKKCYAFNIRIPLTAIVHIRIRAAVLRFTLVLRGAAIADIAQVPPAMLTIDDCAAVRTAHHSLVLSHKTITHPAPVQPTTHMLQRYKQT